MIGIIAGTNIMGSKLPERKTIDTPYGKVHLARKANALLLQRHEGNTPPHRINHKANIHALKQEGIDYVIGIGSTGSLKKEIKPPCLAVPDDYINFYNIPTYYDNEIKHITPGLSENVRKLLLQTAKRLGHEARDGGVYFQATGPRFETKAEIRFISKHADIVGMTIASEATLAKELDLEYAALCSVDNYANGISGTVTYEKLTENVKATQHKIEEIIEALAR